jgi:DNA modification methylase
LRTPKQQGIGRTPRWYPYYAGYSAAFVEDALDGLDLAAEALVLDPWNGAGTTTTASVRKGFRATGCDVNPVLVLVARGRLLGSNTQPSLTAIADEVVEQAVSGDDLVVGQEDEPLRQWFDVETAGYLRSLEITTQRLLVDHHASRPLAQWAAIEEVSDIASALYVALFEVVRRMVAPFRGTNPTWTRVPSTEAERLTVSKEDIGVLYVEAVARLLEVLRTDLIAEPGQLPAFRLASSTKLPLDDDQVDAVIASPPYCTRIDYVRATLPELALVGLTGEGLRSLQESMIGTTAMTKSVALDDAVEWPDSVGSFLNAVQSHESKASRTYYYKYFQQYFGGMRQSLEELRRVVRPEGRCMLVVQDSFYKDVHNDLPQHIIELAEQAGWRNAGRHDYQVRHQLAAINPGARAYRSTFRAQETAITLA